MATQALTVRQYAALKLFNWAKKQVGTLPLHSVENRMGWGWWPAIRESWAGAWQHNEEITVDNVTTHPTLFACVTLIASDVAKMRMRLVQDERDEDIWTEVSNPSFSPVLRKPNHYQSRIQFYTTWSLSKQLWGNTYVLLARDARRVVTRQYVLDPSRTRPLVAPDGSVFYQTRNDNLSFLPESAYVFPASELIHDRFNTLFHPLVGLSPIYAAGLAAVQALNIQNSSTKFFENGAQPGGVLTAPGAISQETADRLKAYWIENFTGDNAGNVAILGDGLKYEAMKETSVDSQLIDQLKWSDEAICRCFHVPPYMVGVGPPPTYNNIEALNQQYYSQCIQILVEEIELLQDEGLGLTEGDVAAKRYGTEFNTADLLRMDSPTRVKAAADSLNAGLAVNEVRRIYHGVGPKKGGDSPLVQQQYYSIEALAERDQDKPFAKPTPAAPAANPRPMTDEDSEEDETKDFGSLLLRKMQPVIQRNADRAA